MPLKKGKMKKEEPFQILLLPCFKQVIQPLIAEILNNIMINRSH